MWFLRFSMMLLYNETVQFLSQHFFKISQMCESPFLPLHCPFWLYSWIIIKVSQSTQLRVEVDITSFYTFNAPKTVKIKIKSLVFFFALWASSVNMLNSSWKIQEQSFLSSATKTSIVKGQCLVPTLSAIFVLVAGPCSKFPQVPNPYPCPQPSSW